jgi:hypothetical protein
VSDVDRLFQNYIALYGSGADADPQPFLAQVAGTDRLELVSLIDGYLERAPLRRFDPAAFRQSPSSTIVDELDRSLAGRAGLWPAVLPQLRHRAGLKRADLVRQLAKSLGVADREAKVARYYHEMERGLLPAAGVSDRVLAALAALLSEPVEAIRDAGRAIRPPAGGTPTAPASAFARHAQSAAEGLASPGMAPPVDEEPDDIDRLFRRE